MSTHSPIHNTGRKPRRLLLPVLGAVAGLSALVLNAQADNSQGWPQWRGPSGTGAAPAANPPVTWSETSNIRWKVKLPGNGSGSPVVWNDRIYLLTAIPAGKKAAAEKPAAPAPAAPAPAAAQQPGRRGGGFGGLRSVQPTEPHRWVLLCLDRKTGKTVWEKTAKEEVPHEGHHPDHGFASHSALTDGENVFAFFGSRGLHCYDMQGNLKWSKDLGRMQTRNGFGEGSSPALSGNTIVVNWDHEGEDFIAALDKRTGKERWRQPREEPTSWSTPLIVEHGGRKQVITAASNKVRSYDLETGKLIWECGGLTGNVIPTPVTKDGVVYVMSGFRGNALLAIRLGREGDLTGTDAVVWSHNRTTPYVPSPLLYGNRLYFFAGNNGILSCWDAAAGKPLIDAERIDGLQGVYASPVGAGGRVYLLGRTGTAVVIKDADKLEILTTNRLEDGFDASPAVVGNELYLRGRESLYCIAEK